MTWRDQTWRGPPSRPAAPRPERAPHFPWCKIPNEFPDYPVLRAAALIAKVPVHQVVAIALRLECLANASVPRGSVADFSVTEFAASLQLRPDAVARVRAALEDPDISWIEQDFIVGFSVRNPESHDHTAAERQRRLRAKRKAERETASQNGLASAAGQGGRSGADWTEPIHSHVTSRRDTVTGHAREEKTKNPLDFDDARASGPVDNCADSGDGSAQGTCKGQEAESSEADEQQLSLLWLETEGVRIVTEQLQENRTLAATKIARWRDQELGGDAAALADIVRGAEKAGYFGARFLNLIVDGIRARVRQATAQGELRLPATIAGTDRKAG